ncbi:lysophospholipid acyltransferase family protein [Sphingomonas swuensis]|uniref:Lysophospholipid acyltransferase family protein n=1 Tax=Sphingomonas swuensis TaxID=977800 RepID=A0ABP7SAB5_9SPHN
MIAYPHLPAAPLPMSRPARLVKHGFVRWFDRGGWSVEGFLPLPDKAVVMGGPHTSNWDFLVFVGAMERMGVQASYIGKASLFRFGPMARFMRGLGGIPVERGMKNDLVAQVSDRLRAADRMLLVIAPEGTREATTEWRMGFYRIALAAGVPIVPGGPDYGRKAAVFGTPIWPTGDPEKDLKPAWEFFRSLTPLHPDKVLFPDGTGMDGRPRAM